MPSALLVISLQYLSYLQSSLIFVNVNNFLDKNVNFKVQKSLEITYKEDFDDLWGKYINSCKNELKLAYNTILRKERMYNKYLKGKFEKRVSKIKKD